MAAPSPFTDVAAPRRTACTRALLRAALILMTAAGLCLPDLALGQQIKVRHTEGLVHGFLALRTLDGDLLAGGDLVQTARGERVTSRLIFRFKDGSRHDETTVFSQDGTFKLLSHHLVQQGPSFPRKLDMRVNVAEQRVTVRYTDDEGEEQVESEDVESPASLVNGLVLTLLKNVSPGAALPTLPMLVATPDPRVVGLDITAAGEEQFSTPGAARKAIHYVLKVEIGGLTGLLAPLLGKQPPDSHVWILAGATPAFVKSEQPLYAGGPVWRIELVSPVWPDKD